jgi:hypothetical protein
MVESGRGSTFPLEPRDETTYYDPRVSVTRIATRRRGRRGSRAAREDTRRGRRRQSLEPPRRPASPGRPAAPRREASRPRVRRRVRLPGRLAERGDESPRARPTHDSRNSNVPEVRTVRSAPSLHAKGVSRAGKVHGTNCPFFCAPSAVPQRDCFGGQRASPYEQKTQQSPGFGLRISPHDPHS